MNLIFVETDSQDFFLFAGTLWSFMYLLLTGDEHTHSSFHELSGVPGGLSHLHLSLRLEFLTSLLLSPPEHSSVSRTCAIHLQL